MVRHSFHLRSRARQGCQFLPLLVSIVLEVLDSEISQEKEIKGTHIRKEELKLLIILTDDMIVHSIKSQGIYTNS